MTKMTATHIPDAGPPPAALTFHPRLPSPTQTRARSGADLGLDARLCFVAGTRLITRDGRVPVERLSAGDMVWTLQNGFQPVRRIGCQTVRLTRSCFLRRPVILRKDALRPGAPLRDMRVSPRVKLLVDDWINEPDLNHAGSYVAAAQLIEQDRAERDLYRKSVTYFFVIFDRPEIVETEGLLSRVPSAQTGVAAA